MGVYTKTTHLTLWLALVILSLVPTATQPPQGSVPAQSAAAHSITIPTDITSYGGIFLQARINNSEPMWFCLDSGASYPFIIDTRQARALRLQLQDHFTREGGAGPNSYDVSETKGVTISLPSLTFKDQSAAVLSLALIDQQLGRSLDGIIGLNLFLRYTVEVDYVGKTLRLYDAQTYTYTGTGESIPLTLRDGHFFVPAKVAMPGRSALNGRFVVDTGGVMVTVALTSPFSRSNDLPAPSQKTISDRSVSGLGGETRLLISRASSFTLGSSVIRAPIIYVSQDTGGALASSEYEGLIGSEVLRRFKVVVDYARRRLILERNSNFEEPSEYDMSGVSFRAYGNDFRTFRVYQVLDDSPAAKAGLRVDDVLAAIDGVPASRLTLEQILQMLKVDGCEYELGIKRGGEMRSVKIKTRRLI
jgi:hypothetical protein